MCVFALLGLILPYALAVILLAIPVLFFLSEKYTQNLRFRSAILIVVTLLLTVGLGWAAILPVTQGVRVLFKQSGKPLRVPYAPQEEFQRNLGLFFVSIIVRNFLPIFYSPLEKVYVFCSEMITFVFKASF